jgi:ribonuclease P protein component
MASVVGRIRRKATFRALSRPEGRAQSGPVSVVFSARAPEAALRAVAGYSVGRRHGGAVERNRMRRRLREAMRMAGAELPAGAYLVRAAPPAAALGFDELCRMVRTAAEAAAKGSHYEERRAR